MRWNQLTLFDVEPIDWASISLLLGDRGWHLKIWHRHLGALSYECEADEYEDLALGEAIDVIEATLLTVGHASHSPAIGNRVE